MPALVIPGFDFSEEGVGLILEVFGDSKLFRANVGMGDDLAIERV